MDFMRISHEGKRVWSLTYKDVDKKVTVLAPHKLNQYDACQWLVRQLEADQAWQDRNLKEDEDDVLVCDVP